MDFVMATIEYRKSLPHGFIVREELLKGTYVFLQYCELPGSRSTFYLRTTYPTVVSSV